MDLDQKFSDRQSEFHVNPGYAYLQISKAIHTRDNHEDPAVRERARERIAKWKNVLENMVSGSVVYGTRKPVDDIPVWATPEVVTGGFPTGAFLAEGPLQEHEIQYLEIIPDDLRHKERRALNAFFLTEDGLTELQNRLESGTYDVAIPEEAALLVVAWLNKNGHSKDALELVESISPYFHRFRFYPASRSIPIQSGSQVHVQDVGATLESLRNIKPNARIKAQKETIDIWIPLHDRVVSLFLETIEEDWPCQHYPADWKERATALLDEFKGLRKNHRRCNRMERPSTHYARLHTYLKICADDSETLTGHQVGHIRQILNQYIAKRGKPGSSTYIESRRRQTESVIAPEFHTLARVVVPRLEKYEKNVGLDDISHLVAPVSDEESRQFGVPTGSSFPDSIRQKVARCLNDTADNLVKQGLITSGEALARVLPQMTSEIRSMGIMEPTLRQLYASNYRAFRKRRSLLLLNLEKQVQIEELPWVAAIERFRSNHLSSQETARQTLEEISILTLTSFPYAILPNKLLQELRGLIKSAGLNAPLTDELAADIFMGTFTDKFVISAKIAAGLLDQTLYARYYNINFESIRKLPDSLVNESRWFRSKSKIPRNDFARLCILRAGVSLDTWNPANNGMIIEQQQILTTQNLAAVFVCLDLKKLLGNQLFGLAQQCFKWICRRQQMKIDKRHARMIMIKNTAYAWRQMIFFLSLISTETIHAFLEWADEHLKNQSMEFQIRFRPALKGLDLAANGNFLDEASINKSDVHQFLGWSIKGHWLLVD